MKIIDLLNKIANGEELPEYVKYFNRNDEEYNIMMVTYENIIYKLNYEYIKLNDEVEILEEEKKIPEKIEIYEDEEGHYFIDKHCKKIYITCDEVNFMVEEFNQLIDYLKSKGE